MAERTRTVEEHLALAEHYVALDMANNIHIGGWGGDFDPSLPWERVSKCEPGGTWRYNHAVSVYFIAPIEPLTFRWSANIETADANGRTGYRLDVQRLETILSRLPDKPRRELIAHLHSIVVEMRKQATESMDFARGLLGDAAVFEALEPTHD